MTFRDALLRIVDDRGISLRAVAIGSGVSYEQLKKLKQGKTRSTIVEDAKKIAEFLGMTLDQFLEGETVQDRIELVELWNALPEAERAYLLASARGVADQARKVPGEPPGEQSKGDP